MPPTRQRQPGVEPGTDTALGASPPLMEKDSHCLDDCVTWLVILKVKSSDLLGNHTQYPVIAYKGRECKDVYSYTRITESLCCTSETNMTL